MSLHARGGDGGNFRRWRLPSGKARCIAIDYRSRRRARAMTPSRASLATLCGARSAVLTCSICPRSPRPTPLRSRRRSTVATRASIIGRGPTARSCSHRRRSRSRRRSPPALATPEPAVTPREPTPASDRPALQAEPIVVAPPAIVPDTSREIDGAEAAHALVGRPAPRIPDGLGCVGAFGQARCD